MYISPEKQQQLIAMLRQHFQELAVVPASAIKSVRRRRRGKLMVTLLVRGTLQVYQLNINPDQSGRS